jgi:cyclopropane-fatty-acyl-phospholipid synthase
MKPAAAVAPASTGTNPPAGLYERLVLRALRAMPLGRLELERADGSRIQLGHPDGFWGAAVRAPATEGINRSALIRVVRPSFYERVILRGDIGFAEAYMEGDWETPDLTAVIAWFVLNIEHAPTLSGSAVGAAGLNLLRWASRLRHLLRPNSRRTAARNIRDHYDLSNDFFALWLDPSMMYSSARWHPGATLEDAQRAKNDLLCHKLQLKPGDRVMEIGTGWGAWSLHAARNYGCRVTTLTLSRQQHDLAVRRVAEAGLADRVEVRLQDYRDLPASETYDKVASIEMLEAVGHRYLDDWCRVVARALKPDGILGLQFITCPDNRYDQFRKGVDFIQAHIFPGSLLLSLNRINALLSRRGGLVLRGVEDMGQDYALTLREWHRRFDARLAEVRAMGFDDRFIRKWGYYLSYCEAAFALRNISVVQTVHTRANALSVA